MNVADACERAGTGETLVPLNDAEKNRATFKCCQKMAAFLFVKTKCCCF